MDRLRLIRWLRIFASAACLIICAGLIALWVRSDSLFDMLRQKLSNDKAIQVYSLKGRLGLRLLYTKNNYGQKWLTMPPHLAVRNLDRHLTDWGFHTFSNRQVGVMIPHWFALLLFATLGTITSAPWLPWHRLRWRFSLRTMLIVTAVVAVMLGIFVWLTR